MIRAGFEYNIRGKFFFVFTLFIIWKSYRQIKKLPHNYEKQVAVFLTIGHNYAWVKYYLQQKELSDGIKTSCKTLRFRTIVESGESYV